MITSAIAYIGCPRQPSPAPEPQALGFKAANLVRMAVLGLPVPPAFVLPTAHSAAALRGDPQEGLARDLAHAVHTLEQATGLGFGDGRRPLCVSVRSGAPVSMPGMMDTVLNVGLSEEAVRGVVRLTGNPRLAWDSYRRLIQGYAEVVHGCPRAPFEHRLAAMMESSGAVQAGELDFVAMRALARQYREVFAEIAGQPFPDAPLEQLEGAVRAVWGSWSSERAHTYRELHGIAHDIGTAVTVQQMVYGNAGGASGAGVGFTRDPADGTARLYVDFLLGAQGEDVVSGRHDADDADRLPSMAPRAHADLVRAAAKLERSFGDMQEFEFTVSMGEFYLLQTRPGKRTRWAALHIALDLADEGIIDRADALSRIDALEPQTIARRVAVPDEHARVLAHAVSASIGSVTGAIALDSAAAARLAANGRVILVREDTTTEDIAGMAVAAGILTATGGRTSHAAVVARQLERVCIVGCSALRIDLAARTLSVGDAKMREGDTLSLDGATGRIYAGTVEFRLEQPTAALERLARLRTQGRHANDHSDTSPRRNLPEAPPLEAAMSNVLEPVAALAAGSRSPAVVVAHGGRPGRCRQ